MCESETSSAEYVTARSRTSSAESNLSLADYGRYLLPLNESGGCPISVSCSSKRDHKDKRIYVNQRTGLPVKPPTSFALFKYALRRSIKDQKVSFERFNKEASRKWAKMSDYEKELYVQRAKILTDRYKKIEVPYLRKKVRDLQNKIKAMEEHNRQTAVRNRDKSRGRYSSGRLARTRA